MSANQPRRPHASQVQKGLSPHPRVRNVIAVGSGKGGVGKSTTSVNLALALVRLGQRVGLLDADIYGPSQPRMLGIAGRPRSADGKKLLPMENYGVRVMSMGFLVDEDAPMIWRGPMVQSALQQMLGDVEWGELDFLVVDLPPEEDDELCLPAQGRGLCFVRLVTPTTDDRRLPTVLCNTGGFLYYVSITGITGTKAPIADQVGAAVARGRRRARARVPVERFSARALAAGARGGS